MGQYSSLSLSPHLSHTTETLTLLRIKCEIYIYFIKKCVRSFIEVRKTMLDYVPAYVCMWLYNKMMIVVSFPRVGASASSDNDT